MTRILSGIQPSGTPHLGNYFGAIVQHIESSKNLPSDDSALFFIADFHALNAIHDREELDMRVRDVAATYLALGLDIEKALFFRQSAVPEVCQLTWLLSSCTSMGLLERGTSYKDKLQRGQSASVGLFTYPVLMAADILIYDSDIVPVGKDQQQHVEFARDMATYFNEAYGRGEEILKTPKWKFSKVPKVSGTDGDKMSKSYGNTIDIFVSGKAQKKQVNKIVTDSRLPEEAKDPDELGALAILNLFFDDEEKTEWADRIRKGGDGAPGYGHIKKEIMTRMDQRFGDAREKYESFVSDDQAWKTAQEILHEGGKRARALAHPVMQRCLEAVGMTS
ncbi:MAG: tryptophan--tRNA ligase [Deltaproteobacteria bacterium]|nr:tryptophan--tRNA ligase [Deltaproteobacteria bacterium]